MNAPKLAIGDREELMNFFDFPAEHPHHQPDRIDLCYDPPPGSGRQGLPEPRHHARHDVQARPVLRKPVAKAACIPGARLGHQRSAVQGWN